MSLGQTELLLTPALRWRNLKYSSVYEPGPDRATAHPCLAVEETLKYSSVYEPGPDRATGQTELLPHPCLAVEEPEVQFSV